MSGIPEQDAGESLLGEWAKTVEENPESVLLWTARGDGENQRSFLFTGAVRVLYAERLEEIPAVFEGVEKALSEGLFVAGFLSYEAGYHFEPTALGGEPLKVDEGLPLAWFGVYREPQTREAMTPGVLGGEDTGGAAGEASVELSRVEYGERVERIRRWIEAGDFYQANFSVNVHQGWTAGSERLFAKLMASQPVPYGAMIHAGRAQILSASPELFFRREGGAIWTRPMKGTAERGLDGAGDARMAAWLAGDEKNRAENVMIVDLIRNDLGRICRAGSVETTELFAVERHAELLQMTSTVRGELRTGTSYYEIFRALFPCGSITGAPKVRTMQAIRELEGEARGIAFGAIGYFAPGGKAVFSVAIRTLMLEDGKARLRVGSGITYDSDSDAEYDECLLKARFLTRERPRFELIETMAWDGEFVLLDLHMRRLKESAEYFDFDCEVEEVRARLLSFAERLERGRRHRVRLLLEQDGKVSITSAPIEVASGPVWVRIATERVDAQDVFLRHKTTRREVQERALAEARAVGCEDAILVNMDGQVTEGAIHNVLIVKDGKWQTPPMECGLLPGVCRQHLLETRPEIEVAPIMLADLLEAKELWICNSVRGLRQAHLWREK